MELLLSPDIWISFLTLCLLEIILGIDNVIFISIVSARLPKEQQKKARLIGLSLALIMRIVMLASIAWIAGLTITAFEIGNHAVSWRDIILAAGGLFLLYKGTLEIHNSVEGHGEDNSSSKKAVSFASVIAQIVVLDLVFSLDSVITAIGLSDHLFVMIGAIVVSIVIMMLAAEPISAFIQRHPTIKMLALSFLLLIGVSLVADALHFHIPRGYLYFAIGFSLVVEALNLLARRKKKNA